jgi:hypothetical protein
MTMPAMWFATWFALWLQDTYTFSSGNAKLLMVFIGLVALSMVAQAAVQIGISLKAGKALKELTEIAEELREKALPLIDTAMSVGKTTEALLKDAAPKVKLITENMAEASSVVRSSAVQVGRTVVDANLRTQRQVARVDGIVTAVLTATVEVAGAVQNGLRGPAQKLAGLATQARFGLEGLLDRVRSMTAK